MSIPKTQKVVLFRETGGPEVLRYEDYPVPEIGAGEILIKNKYAGVNFIESYFRTGLYPAETPYVLGREASGVVVAVGDNVTDYKVGDKVAYMSPATFAQYTKQDLATGRIIKLPEDADDATMKKLAGVIVNGFTVLTFITEAYPVKKGDYILVPAIAGGCGLVYAQLLKQLGAIVIGTASTDEKLLLGKEYGADYVIKSSDDVVAEVMKITDGKGVQAVFDGVGKDTFEAALAAVARKGTIISFGNASGPVPPLLINRLSPKNVKIARPQLYAYVATPEEWQFYADKMLTIIKNGLKVNITETYPLSDYKTLTTRLEGRKTTGKLVLEIPQ